MMKIGEIIDELKNAGYSDADIREFEIENDEIQNLAPSQTEILCKEVEDKVTYRALLILSESNSLEEAIQKLKSTINEQ